MDYMRWNKPGAFWQGVPKPVLEELIRMNKDTDGPKPKDCPIKSEEACLMCEEMGHICEAAWMGEQAYHYDDEEYPFVNDYTQTTMDTSEDW